MPLKMKGLAEMILIYKSNHKWINVAKYCIGMNMQQVSTVIKTHTHKIFNITDTVTDCIIRLNVQKIGQRQLMIDPD